VTGGELERQTGALGESNERDSIRWHASPHHIVDDSVQTLECGTELRLVLFHRSQKGVRIPRVVGGFRRHVRDIRDLELIREREDRFSGGTAAVHEHDDEPAVERSGPRQMTAGRRGDPQACLIIGLAIS
jgi:hypothetical protein